LNLSRRKPSVLASRQDWRISSEVRFDTKLHGPAVFFILKKTITVRTFLIGCIGRVVQVHKFAKDLEVLVDAVLRRGIDLEVRFDVAVAFSVAAEFVEVGGTACAGEAKAQRAGSSAAAPRAPAGSVSMPDTTSA